MNLAGSVTADAIGATFTFPGGATTLVTALFGVVDDVHTVPHSGADLGLFDGSPVPCLAPGTVAFVSEAAQQADDSWGGIFGNSCIVQHPDGTRALYAHMQEVHVAVGDAVVVGTQLGLSGHTGFYNGEPVGPHLHLGLAPEGNQWLNKDPDGGVTRLLDPLANLSGDTSLPSPDVAVPPAGAPEASEQQTANEPPASTETQVPETAPAPAAEAPMALRPMTPEEGDTLDKALNNAAGIIQGANSHPAAEIIDETPADGVLFRFVGTVLKSDIPADPPTSAQQ